MKKKLIVLSLLSFMVVACNQEKSVQQAEKAEQPVAVAVETTETPVENAKGTVEAVEEKVEEVVEFENQYSNFQKEMVEKFKDKGITNLTVSAYAKGIDLIFNTENKKMTKEQFEAIATDVVKELKSNFDFIPADSKINCSLEYQPDPKENVEFLMSSDIK